MSYSIDSSELIEAWHGHYRPAVVSSLWEVHFPRLIAARKLTLSRSVFEELKVGGDSLFDWVRDNAISAVVEDEQAIQTRVRDIQANWPRSETDFLRRLRGADLFVIAHAQASVGMVLTDEHLSGDLLHPRIPDACRHLGIAVGRIVDMLEAEGLRL